MEEAHSVLPTIEIAQCGKNMIFLLLSQNLREINFWDSGSAKSAILTHLEAVNFDFYEFLHFLKAEIYQMNKIHSP